MSSNRITDQLTEAGRSIERNSFAIVDAEAGEHNYAEDQWGVVRRMIHASADFEFNGLTRFSENAVAVGREALASGAAIIADVEMICVGLSKPRLAHFGVTTYHFISDADVIEQAKKKNTTRAVQAIRKAHDKKLIDGGIVAVGNAPTALLEIIRLVREENVKPALVIGMPVGFVSALESKEELCTITQTEWVITHGRKGGSPLVVAAIHALLAFAE